MDFTLQIEFVGVCMFVPDPVKRMFYVLMPGTGHEDHAGHAPPHVVRLCVDTAYLVKGSSGPNGVIALAVMDGVDLSFGARRLDEKFPPALGTDVVEVGAEPSRPISPIALGDSPGSVLAGRATLFSGTRLPPSAEDGVCWTYEGKDGRLVNRLRWSIDCEGESLTLSPGTPFMEGIPAPKIPTLYPIDQVVKVSIYHAPLDDLPPNPDTPGRKPSPGDAANHFNAYYSLFEYVDAIKPVPRFLDDCRGAGKWGGSPYTCMLAQSPPLKDSM